MYLHLFPWLKMPDFLVKKGARYVDEEASWCLQSCDSLSRLQVLLTVVVVTRSNERLTGRFFPPWPVIFRSCPHRCLY
jgi:hypothetical protein